MAKTQEELNTLKNEYETVTNKLKELNDEELGYVTGGTTIVTSGGPISAPSVSFFPPSEE